jgi:hypothetical protein
MNTNAAPVKIHSTQVPSNTFQLVAKPVVLFPCPQECLVDQVGDIELGRPGASTAAAQPGREPRHGTP